MKMENKYMIQIRSIKYTRWKYVFLGIIMMLCLGTVYSWSIFRMPVETTFQVGSTLSGMPYMTSLAFYSLFMLFSGKYLNRYNPKTIVLTGSFFIALGWILAGVSDSIYLLTFAYGILGGAGVGIVYGVPISLATKWFPDRKGLAIGLVVMGFGLSPMITAPIIQALLQSYGLMQTFLILGVSFGVMLPLSACLLRYPLPVELTYIPQQNAIEEERNSKSTHQMLKSKNFIGLYLNFMIAATIGLMLVGLTTKVGTGFGISNDKMPLLMLVFALCNGIGRPVFGWLTEHILPRRVMLTSYGLIMLACTLMLLPGKEKSNLFILAFSIFWINLGAWLTIAPTTTIMNYGARHYTQNYGVVFTAYGVGAILGVLSSGVILDIFQNFQYLFCFIMFLCLLGILTTITMMKPKVNET